MAVSHDSCLAASGSFDKSVIIWDLNKKCLKSLLKGHSGAVYCVVFSVDEEFIISGERFFEIIIWKVSSSECLKILRTNLTVFSLIVVSNVELISATYNRIEKWDLINLIQKINLG